MTNKLGAENRDSLHPSNSTRIGLSSIDKLAYYWGLLRMRFQGRSQVPSFDWILQDAAEYDRCLQQHGGGPLAQARVVEIGFGARPFRLVGLHCLGIDVQGLDLDRPVLTGGPSEILSIYRTNGWERAVKSFVRHHFIDGPGRRAFAKQFGTGPQGMRVAKDRLHVVDAGSEKAARLFSAGSIDLIYSEDVFEHIPATVLPGAIANMVNWLRPGGLALLRPNIFTGITGGHLLEWYPYTIADPRSRRSEPWEHLRRRRFFPDTYLNELRRRDYRRLFGEHFEILEERVRFPALGATFLTPDIRTELADYDEDELFSNQVLFVLRRRLASGNMAGTSL